MRLISMLVFTSLSLVGCLPEDSSSVFVGTQWTLNSYGFKTDVKTNIIENSSYSLEFEEDRLTGTIDCNSFQSNYSATQNTLEIESIAVTEMACSLMSDPAYILQNTFVINALSNVTSYVIFDQKLTLTSADSSELVFVESQ